MKLAALILLIIFTQSCDIIERKKFIGDRYYLMHSDELQGETVYYKTSEGDFIGRIPVKIAEYSVTDSFVFAKSIINNEAQYFLIIKKYDSDYAEVTNVTLNINSQQLDSISKKHLLSLRWQKVNP